MRAKSKKLAIELFVALVSPHVRPKLQKAIAMLIASLGAPLQ